jgi:hypothetical protein
MWAENADVIGSCDLCLWAATAKFTMRAETHQFEAVIIRFAIDENEIGLDMAVAVIAPFTGKHMVEISSRQRLIGGEQVDYLHEQSVQFLTFFPWYVVETYQTNK